MTSTSTSCPVPHNGRRAHRLATTTRFDPPATELAHMNLRQLGDALRRFCEQQDLTVRDAYEMALCEALTPSQRRWLDTFCSVWEWAETREAALAQAETEAGALRHTTAKLVT